MLKVKGTQIVNAAGQPVKLRGVNLGGWLMMEAYFTHAPSYAEQLFKKKFAKVLGTRALRDFEHQYREHFIQEEDVRLIRSWGMNVVRLPFNYRLIEKAPGKFDTQGLAYLDRTIAWAKRHKLWVILDLHAAPGAQNHDWHSDSLGPAQLWTSPRMQKQTCAIWEFLADRYKNEEAVAGYDILNEAVLSDVKLLNRFYRDVIKAIRSVDRRHILFVEGNTWAQDLTCLDDFTDDNLAFSIHFYHPIEYTFNYIPFLKYPLVNGRQRFDRKTLKKMVGDYVRIARERNRPVYVGEFGINGREGVYREQVWLKDLLALFGQADFHWTYWTYKAVKNALFPDGILSYRGNPPWVNRAGPVTGWDTYHLHWPTQRREMIASWLTKEFSANEPLLKVLQDACR